MMSRIPTQHTLNTPYPVGQVHCYSTELNGELVLLDTGPQTDAAKEYLTANIDLPRLQHVIISHCHIDHYGLAKWLQQQTDATIYLPFRDCLKIERHQERMYNLYNLLLEIGFTADFLDHFKGTMEDGTVFPELPQSYRVIEEGLPEQLGIEVLACPGHSQSDLVLAGANWAVTGDTMLRGIFQSPLLDVDLLSGVRFNNYDAYCATIQQLAKLRGKLILPGHRYSIESVDANILFYVGKLLERAVLTKAIDPARPIAEVALELCAGAKDQMFFAYVKASELLFIRDFHEHPQLLRQSLEKIGLFPQVAELYDAALPPA